MSCGVCYSFFSPDTDTFRESTVLHSLEVEEQDPNFIDRIRLIMHDHVFKHELILNNLFYSAKILIRKNICD